MHPQKWLVFLKVVSFLFLKQPQSACICWHEVHFIAVLIISCSLHYMLYKEEPCCLVEFLLF